MLLKLRGSQYMVVSKGHQQGHFLNILSYYFLLRWCSRTHKNYSCWRFCPIISLWGMISKYGYCYFLEKWKITYFYYLSIWCQQYMSQKTVYFPFWPMAMMTSTVDIMLMPIQHFLPTGDAGGKMSALCRVLIIYFCLSVRALVEINHARRFEISIEL